MASQGYQMAQMIGQGVGTMYSAEAEKEQGLATNQEMQYKAAVARNNAVIAQQNAEAAVQAGDVRAQAYMIRGGMRIGSAKANYSRGNIDVGAPGSSNNVMRDLGTFQTMDALTIRNNASREAWKFLAGAQQDESDAGAYLAAGRNAQHAGDTAAQGSIIMGFASVGEKWSQWQTTSPTTTHDTGEASDNVDFEKDYFGNDDIGGSGDFGGGGGGGGDFSGGDAGGFA